MDTAKDILAAFWAARPATYRLFAWLEQQRARKDDEAVLAEMLALPEWSAAGARLALAAFEATLTSKAAKRAERQLFWAGEVAKFPFASVGGRLERVIKADGDKIEAATWPVLLAWWGQQRPIAKAFFAQPAVLAKVPDTIDLSDLPVGPRRDLAGVKLKGKFKAKTA